MTGSLRHVLVAGALVVLAAAPAAHAGKPGVWTRLTDPATGAAHEWSALARSADGVLHVTSTRADTADATKRDLLHVAVQPNGKAAPANVIVAGWGLIGRSALVVDPAAGLRVLFGGASPTATNQGLSTATSADGGATWALSPADVAPPTVLGNEGPTGATVDASGTVFSTFGAVSVLRGLAAPDPAAIPSFEANGGGSGNLVAAPAGTVWAAWFSPGSSADDRGTLFQAVDPATGAPAGERKVAPSSGGNGAAAPGQPVALAALLGGKQKSVLAGYLDTKSHLVHIVDVTNPDLHGEIPGSRDAAQIVIAADPQGHAWFVWRTPKNRIAALRTNVGATDIGEIVQIRPPTGTQALVALNANAQSGVLDIVAQAQIARGATVADNGIAAWHTQLRPGLSLRLSRFSVRRSSGGVVTFRVLDAGAPVRGAVVRIGRKTLRTNAAGKAQLRVARGAAPSVRAVTATKAGYTASPTFALRVVR